MNSVPLTQMFTQDMVKESLEKFYSAETLNNIIPFCFVTKTGFIGLSINSNSVVGFYGWHTIAFNGVEEFGCVIGTFNDKGELCTFQVFSADKPYSWFGLVHSVRFFGLTQGYYSFVGWKVGQEGSSKGYDILSGEIIAWLLNTNQITGVEFDGEPVAFVGGDNFPIYSVPFPLERGVGLFKAKHDRDGNVNIAVSVTGSPYMVNNVLMISFVNTSGLVERRPLYPTADGVNNFLDVPIKRGSEWKLYGCIPGSVINNATPLAVTIQGIAIVQAGVDEEVFRVSGAAIPITNVQTGQYFFPKFGQGVLKVGVSGAGIASSQGILIDSAGVTFNKIPMTGLSYFPEATFDERAWMFTIIPI